MRLLTKTLVLSCALALASCEVKVKSVPPAEPSPTPEVNPVPSPSMTPAPSATPEATPVATPSPAPTVAAIQPLQNVPDDNAKAPHIAVFKGSVDGVKKPYGAQNNAAYAAWLNRNVVWAEDTQPGGSWDNMSGQAWQLAPWSNWKKVVPGRRLILNICIIPGPWDGSGPQMGKDAGIPVSLEDGAAGKYNEYYRKLAENLVKYGLEDSILRLGCEFNGGWFAWRAQSDAKAKAFAGYFREIVKTMRSVPGAEGLKFDWNVGLGWCSFDPENAWPGDEYVDFVGIDTYDDCYAPNTYPFPKNASEAEKDRIRKKVWHDHILGGKFGLSYWSDFARKHGKPMSLPEWGVNNKPDGHGGGDNPYFIEQMYEFINDPRNNVAYHSYFDYQAGDGHHQLSPTREGKIVTEFPRSAEKFQKLFSLPPSGNAGAPPQPLPVY